MLIEAPLAETVWPDNVLQKHCMAATRPTYAVLEAPTVLRRAQTSFAGGTRFIRRSYSMAAHRLRTHALLGALHDDPAKFRTGRFLATLMASINRSTQHAKISATCG